MISLLLDPKGFGLHVDGNDAYGRFLTAVTTRGVAHSSRADMSGSTHFFDCVRINKGVAIQSLFDMYGAIMAKDILDVEVPVNSFILTDAQILPHEVDVAPKRASEIDFNTDNDYTTLAFLGKAIPATFTAKSPTEAWDLARAEGYLVSRDHLRFKQVRVVTLLPATLVSRELAPSTLLLTHPVC